MGEIYPEAFAELLALVPELERGGNLPAAYNQLLMSADVDLRDRAARAWCDEAHGGGDITDQLLVLATNRFAR